MKKVASQNKCDKGHQPKHIRKDGECHTCCMAAAMRRHRLKYPQVYSDRDRDKDREYRVRVRKKLKGTIFEALGNKCECCKETNPIFLCIDHKKGGGGKHRKESSSYRIFYWLYRQVIDKGADSIKEDFRILCWNCNSAYGLHGFCPHQEGIVICP